MSRQISLRTLAAAIVAAVVLVSLIAWALTRGTTDELPGSSAPSAGNETSIGTEGSSSGLSDDEVIEEAIEDGLDQSDGRPHSTGFFDNPVDELKWVQSVRDQFPTTAKVSKSFSAFPPVAYGTTDAFAARFTRQLLEVDYADDSWDDLMAWVRYEAAADPAEAPMTDEDMTVALLARLLDVPDSDGVAPIVVNEQEWNELAAQGATQHVRNIVVSADPLWQQVIAAGREDDITGEVLADCVMVAFTLDRTVGLITDSRDLSWRFCVGSADQHGAIGYGGASTLEERP